MAVHLDLGRTKTFLEGLGYEILDENWTHGKAEIDLIAYKDKVIIFAEVKTRTGNGFGEPEDFVTIANKNYWLKQQMNIFT
jgi:putative endonuclease